MKKIVKAFFYVFSQSLFPNAHYYSKILKAKFSFSIKYFSLLILILNTFFIGHLAIKYNPNKISPILSAVSSSLSHYPENLIILINNGNLITNNNKPYFMWLDYDNKKNLFLVIDESAKPQKILVYKSTFLLTANEVIHYNYKNNSFSSFPLTNLNNQKITKEKIAELKQNIDKFRSFLPFVFFGIFLLLIIFIPIVSFVITIIYLLIATTIVYFIFKFFMKKHFRYKKILQVSFHSVTFPLLVDYFFMIFKPTVKITPSLITPLQQIPFPVIFLIILGIFVGIGVYESHLERKEDKKSPSSKHVSHHQSI